MRRPIPYAPSNVDLLTGTLAALQMAQPDTRHVLRIDWYDWAEAELRAWALAADCAVDVVRRSGKVRRVKD